MTRTGIRLCRQRFVFSRLPGRFVVGSAEELPYADGTFDCVCSMGVIHHIPDAGRAVGEFYRVLKPGGRLILMVYHRNSAYYRLSMALRRLRTGKSMPQIVRGVDGQENPKGEVYSRSEVRRLLRRFANVECFSGLLSRGMIPRIGRMVPGAWLHGMERWWGWFLYAKAWKPRAG